MDLQSVKEFLESDETFASSDVLPGNFYNTLILLGIHVDLAESGHLLCSMKIPPRLVNSRNFLHGGGAASLIDVIGGSAIATLVGSLGVTLEQNISYFEVAFLDEEIEIEAKVLRVAEAIGVVNVELRKKKTGKLVAHASQTSYLAAGYSKL